MRSKIILAIVAAFLISGCVVTNPQLAKSGWGYSQQSEFLNILKSDKYASLCELEPMYKQYLQTKDANLFNKLFVGYVQNLANSCININSFRASQRAKKVSKTKTHYDIHIQSAQTKDIMLQLQSGKSIEDILKPYVPTVPQFDRLLSHYHSMRSAGDSEQLRKVKLNIERTKLMKPMAWDTYVLINVLEYKFRLFENGSKTMEFAVVVGKRKWQTPIFSSTLKYVVLNPTWNVPDNIARDEFTPSIIRNPDILKRKNMVVRRDYNIDSPHVDPKSVKWKLYLTEAYKKKNLPHKIIQRSSDRNALGTVKFMFPNQFAVYMHDTQTKNLFTKKQRAYSHGRIRLAEPQKLLKHISSNYTVHGYNKTQRRSGKKKQKYINLNRHIPVRITYFTAYVDEDGILRFFNDVYGFDARQKLKGAL